MIYIVYKTTCLVNGKIYIGVHCSPDTKDDGYIGCGVKGQVGESRKYTGFPAAVKKYGYKNFTREILAEFPGTDEGEKAAYDMEKELVDEKFIARKDTYNIILGGKAPELKNLHKKVVQYTKEGKFIRVWDSIKEAKQVLGFKGIHIGSKFNKTVKGFQWRHYTGDKSDIEPVQYKMKTIYQFNLNGKFIKEWKSIDCIMEENKYSPETRKQILNCCYRRRYKAVGYHWSFINKFPDKRINKFTRIKRTVYQFDLSGNLIKIWDSLMDAARSYPNVNSARSKIVQCCNHRASTWDNTCWSYENKFEYVPKGVPVAKYDLNGNFIEAFDTMKEAAAAHGINPSNLSGTIMGRQSILAGFQWRKFTGDTSNIQPLKR